MEPVHLFSGLTFAPADNGWLEQASRPLFSEAHHLPPEALRQPQEPHCLLIPEKIRTKPHWEGHYGPAKLHPLEWAVPKTDESFHAVVRLLEQIAQTMKALHYDFGPETPQYLWSDRSKIKQILMNLLSNAIKFTPAGKTIFLKAGFQEEKIVLEVRDEGIGISAEKQATIFDPFVQADPSISREYQGTSLGLAITRNMVEMLGGRIEVESQAGVGSTFRVFIPYQEPVRITTERAEIRLDKVRLPAGARILAVEDNPMNQEMIKAFFKEMNHDILMAHDGSEGVTMAGQYRPDLIFMDIHMPGVDGFEAMRRIRKKDKKTPIVALSADAFTEQQKRAIAAGFTDYITKPIKVMQVIECLQKYLIRGGAAERPDEAKAALSQAEKKVLEGILQQLAETPIFETEKLVELLESASTLAGEAWQEATLDAIYAGDQDKVLELINQLKKE